MPDIVGGVDKMRCLPEKGVHPRGNHNGIQLALLASGPREHLIARILGGRKRLAGQSRLQQSRYGVSTDSDIKLRRLGRNIQ